MPFSRDSLTHLAGTFLIHADAAFLNGRGIDHSSEYKNVVVPKLMRVRQGQRVLLLPYVSAQSWRRWLRNTANEENGWPSSELRAIGSSKNPEIQEDDLDADDPEDEEAPASETSRSNTKQASTECDPIDFPEDDLFGYMRAEPKKKNSKSTPKATQESQHQQSGGNSRSTPRRRGATDGQTSKKNTSVQRTSPFRTSLLRAVPGTSETTDDPAFVHLKDGTPLPYVTKFYSAHLQAIFGLDVARLGRFQNFGSKQELGEELLQKSIASKKLEKLSSPAAEEIYELKDKNVRWTRTQGLLQSLVRLRGGAKQAAFATDVTPKVLIFAGLKSGNLLFNEIFFASNDGLVLGLPIFKQILDDYKDYLLTPVFLGYREGFLSNQREIESLLTQEAEGKVVEAKDFEPEKAEKAKIVLGSPVQVVEAFCKLLGPA